MHLKYSNNDDDGVLTVKEFREFASIVKEFTDLMNKFCHNVVLYFESNNKRLEDTADVINKLQSDSKTNLTYTKLIPDIFTMLEEDGRKITGINKTITTLRTRYSN